MSAGKQDEGDYGHRKDVNTLESSRAYIVVFLGVELFWRLVRGRPVVALDLALQRVLDHGAQAEVRNANIRLLNALPAPRSYQDVPSIK